MKTNIEIPVRSTEVDAMGHVNNAKYLEYMEWGRENWYRKAGYSFNYFIEKSLGVATVNINIDYLGECYMEDILTVKTTPVKVGNKSFVLFQEIYKKETRKKVSQAYITSVVFDMKTRKSIPVPSDLKDHFVGYESAI